jgi:3D (Asp-Asp-Asp) domain-containing protein
MRRVYIVAVIMAVLLIVNAVALAAVAPAPAPPSAPEADKLIKHGARGDDVKVIQKLLADTGYYVGQIDGVFGGATLEAVKSFQTYNGLTPDGAVGKETIAFLQRERATTEPGRYSRQLTMYATAYTAHDAGNSSYTSRGHELRKGLVAVDPRVIPLGTRLFITGYGFAIADDIGGAIKGNKIDLAFESRAEALQFGVQRVTVYILD